MRSHALALLFVVGALGCSVEPFDPAGKTCRADALCPSPYTCVFPPAVVASEAGGEEGDAGQGPREGVCTLLPCARIVCPTNEVCVNDACLPKDCTQVPCGQEEVCADGKCVAKSCVGVECDPQSGCALAECFGRACADRTCGTDELCVSEACVDARCLGVVCPANQSCVRGFCYQQSCGSAPCGEGELCVGSVCVEQACVGVTCPTGLRCVHGNCQLCPDGLAEVQGSCIAPKANGASCQQSAECDAGSCVDGRCCGSASCGACQRCDVAGSEGTCAPVDAGSVDPSCQNYACTAEGACGTSCTLGKDCAPASYCDVDQCAPKKLRGLSCTVDAECFSSQCVSGVCCDTACGGPCESCVVPGLEGTCTASAAGTALAACAPYKCVGDGGCATSCSSDAGCATGSSCQGSVCTGKKGPGGSCDAGVDCLSGFCTDLVCCNSGCGGACEQCNTAGYLGTCKPLPDRSAGSPSCSPRVCNGDAGSCPTTCTSDLGCATNYYCAGGACLAKKGNGGGCTLAHECQSGVCAGGVCCNTTCTGACQTCSATPGSCTAKTGGTACTVSGITGSCVGSSCEVTRSAVADLDAWFASINGSSNNWGNGSGDRLQVGKTDYVAPAGAGMNRTFLRFPLTALLQGVPDATSIQSATLKLKVRNSDSSCWSLGGSIRFFVEELTADFEENSYSTVCSVTANGTAASRWPGPGATQTNRAVYSGAPGGGDWISIDVTALLRAAKTSGKGYLRLRLIASNSSGAYDELTESHKVSFHSRHTTWPPTLELTFAP